MIKIAAVGCGGVMREHYRHLRAHPEVRIVGHFDADRARAEAAAAKFGGEAYDSLEALYDKARPDAAYIAVPPYAHGDAEEFAAARGIHFFVEKPVALDRATARRISAAVRKAKIQTSAGYCYRYYDTIQLARQLLKGRAISMVQGWFTCGMPEAWWWRRSDKSGGQFTEQTTHIFDLIRYLCGEAAEVFALGATGCMTKVPDFDIYDSGIALLRLKNGAAASVSASCLARHDGRVGLEIITPEAVYCFDSGRLTVKEAGKHTEYRPQGNIFAEETAAFIEAVRSGKRGRVRSTYADAVKSLHLTIAAHESIASGLPAQP